MTRKQRITTVLLVLLIIAAPVIAAHLTNSVEVNNNVPVAAPSGPQVTIQGNTNVDMREMFPDANTVELTTEAGNITFTSTGDTNASVHKDEITGTWTNITAIDATSNDLTVNPEDKAAVTVGGDIDRIRFQDASNIGVDDGTVDFTYAGTTGTSKVTLSGVPQNTKIGAVDAATNELLDASESDGSGSITFTSLTNSEHDVKLVTSDGRPELSNPSPTGEQSTPPSQISIDVDDPDFPSDNVTVNITLDGSTIHTETLTSSGTVTVSIPSSGQTGGSHDWSVNATDGYDQSRVENYEYKIPANITIRNETNTSELVDTPTTVSVNFIASDQTYTRETTTGTIDMTGLPVGQDFIVGITTDGNWTDRTVYLESIYQQQSVYLLNTTEYSTIETRFTLEDPTGRYGPDTVVYISKLINQSGTTTYRVIHSDEFGVEGVTAELEEDQRYQIRVQSADGESQIVGPYRSDVSETVTVKPGSPTIPLGEQTDGWSANADLDNRTLEYVYSDPENKTDQLTVYIHEKGNESNKLQVNQTFFDLGNASQTLTLTENESKKTWEVNFIIERDGEIFTKPSTVSNNPDLVPDLSREWRLITGVGLLMISAGMFSILNASVGAVIVAIQGGVLWWIGYLEGATTGIAVVIALFIALMTHIYTTGRP